MRQCCDTLALSTKQWWYELRQNPLLLAWNLSAVASVLVPLIVYWIHHAQNEANSGDDENNGWKWWWNNNNDDDDNNNNNDEQGGWWYTFWSGGEERRDEEEGSSGLVFVYLWTLVLFIVLAYHGHKHIQSRSENGSFLLGLFMFSNLTFVACILLIINIRNMEERQLEEYGFFGMFAGCMVLTYILWTFLCSVFCGILYKPNDKDYDSSSSDYQRHTESSSNNNRWWGGGGSKKKEEEKQNQSGGWMSGWNDIPEKKETTGTGIKVKTAGEEEDTSLAPFQCFGSDKGADEKQQGTMA